MPSAFTQQRLAHLESLAAELPDRGLVSRMLGGDDPVLWVWHPGSGRQTIVFATPAKDGWLFLWSLGRSGERRRSRARGRLGGETAPRRLLAPLLRTCRVAAGR
ncbi:hypothetical protein ACFQX6_27890 [Streptosporangium lutulentum]